MPKWWTREKLIFLVQSTELCTYQSIPHTFEQECWRRELVVFLSVSVPLKTVDVEYTGQVLEHCCRVTIFITTQSMKHKNLMQNKLLNQELTLEHIKLEDHFCGHGSNFHVQQKRINAFFQAVLPQSIFSTQNACHNLYWEHRIGAFSSQGCDQQHWKLKTKLMQVLEFPKISQMTTEKLSILKLAQIEIIVKRVLIVQPWLETGYSFPLESFTFWCSTVMHWVWSLPSRHSSGSSCNLSKLNDEPKVC